MHTDQDCCHIGVLHDRFPVSTRNENSRKMRSGKLVGWAPEPTLSRLSPPSMARVLAGWARAPTLLFRGDCSNERLPKVFSESGCLFRPFRADRVIWDRPFSRGFASLHPRAINGPPLYGGFRWFFRAPALLTGRGPERAEVIRPGSRAGQLSKASQTAEAKRTGLS